MLHSQPKKKITIYFLTITQPLGRFEGILSQNIDFQAWDKCLSPVPHRVITWCRLTSWRDKQGVPWLQTPYYDREGKLIGIQNRNLIKGARPRFRFPSGSKCSIYNLPVLNLLKPEETLYITEGCSDCWAMLSSGHKAIAIPSATLLSRKDIELLKSLNSQPSSLNLTEHFTLAEFERSATATALGIDNSVPPHYIPVLQQLCREVLEPLRAFVGQPIVITSGYRCNQLNVKVGGAYASQHTLGEAADLKLPLTPYTDWKDNRRHTDLDEAKRWMEFFYSRNSCSRKRILQFSNS